MGGSVITSVLSLIECRSKPTREQDADRRALNATFFSSADLTLLNVDQAISERATALRATYNLKTPDAIHLATAVLAAATMLVTTDNDFARCRDLSGGLRIEVVAMA